MIEPLQKNEFNQFRDLLVTVCGIVLKDDQDYLVETRLTELLYEENLKSFSELYDKIKIDHEMLSRVVDLMTTNETLWFRDESCWKTIEKLILPRLIKKARDGGQKVRIWSAASSTGQEAYSFVLLLMEMLDRTGEKGLLDRFEIKGTDISVSAVFLAKKARYDPFTISRGMSPERLAAFFEKDKSTYLLKEEVKSRVEFIQFNLMNSFSSLGKFDLVFCRNVAIYFSNEFKQELFRKISQILHPDGNLMMGATESLFGLNTNFESMTFENGLYYQLKK
ncbi:MAG: protein-glutamate O-methyltransferase CheR [Deltaproteobacteria bacterium]|nr:protein-glutamate O-methyltransferase CheR [Deltaproteobacteria bacterium]